MFNKDYDLVNLNNELNEAVIAGDLNKIKHLFSLEETPYVDHEINGIPVIMYSAQKAMWDLVEEFYNLEANLDAKVPYMDWYLIHECVKNAPDRVTKAILEYCNINSQTKDGKTALMVASNEKKLDIADYFLDFGKFDLSITDKNFNNIAHYFATNKQYELFIKSVEMGCPINQENKDGRTPLDLIEDPTFKENFSKILSSRIKKDKGQEENQDDTISDNQQINTEPKPKVTGLSKIKRR